MLLQVELADGTKIIANEAREIYQSRYGSQPVRQFNINFGKGNTLSVDELLDVFGKEGNLNEFKVYRRESVLGENGEEVYGEFELVDTVTRFSRVGGAYKDFYSKQINMNIEM